MAETLRENRPFGEGKHRADEILVHHRSWWQSAGPLLGLLALLALGLFALWAFRRNRMPEVTVPQVEAPALEQPSLPAAPALPEPAAPDVPRLAEPVAAPELAQPTPPSEPAPAPVVAPPGEACSGEAVFHFTTNATELRSSDFGAADRVAECLKANPDEKLRLEGRADVRGDEEHNRALALGRAQSVKVRLTDLGVEESRLSIVVGEPTCTEATESCWQQDRSVTVTRY